MAFSIKFLDDRSKKVQLGQITIGDFSEEIETPTHYWSKRQYYAQWMEAIERIVNSHKDIDSMLMVSMHPPKQANFYACWPIYKSAMKYSYVTIFCSLTS